MSKINSMIGNRYNMLQVIKREGNRSYNILVKCDCGNEKYADYRSVFNGKTKSCGCYRKIKVGEANKERVKHNLIKTHYKLYTIYKSMKQRCNNSNNKAFEFYGGKGVRVCEEWSRDVIKFIEWSESNGYIEGLSIDRIDSNGNYEPSNCRWVTMSDNIAKRNKENPHTGKRIRNKTK